MGARKRKNPRTDDDDDEELSASSTPIPRSTRRSTSAVSAASLNLSKATVEELASAVRELPEAKHAHCILPSPHLHPDADTLYRRADVSEGRQQKLPKIVQEKILWFKKECLPRDTQSISSEQYELLYTALDVNDIETAKEKNIVPSDTKAFEAYTGGVPIEMYYLFRKQVRAWMENKFYSRRRKIEKMDWMEAIEYIQDVASLSKWSDEDKQRFGENVGERLLETAHGTGFGGTSGGASSSIHQPHSYTSIESSLPQSSGVIGGDGPDQYTPVGDFHKTRPGNNEDQDAEHASDSEQDELDEMFSGEKRR